MLLALIPDDDPILDSTEASSNQEWGGSFIFLRADLFTPTKHLFQLLSSILWYIYFIYTYEEIYVYRHAYIYMCTYMYIYMLLIKRCNMGWPSQQAVWILGFIPLDWNESRPRKKVHTSLRVVLFWQLLWQVCFLSLSCWLQSNRRKGHINKARKWK